MDLKNSSRSSLPAVMCPGGGGESCGLARQGLLPRVVAVFLLFFCALLPSARAAIQFDVFLGYEGIVPEASWFPLVCEIKNDGPPFNGIVEITPGNLNQGQARRAAIELPTGTLKRLVIPVFSTSRGYSTWDVRLLDERGKVRAEQRALRPRKQLASGATMLGALTRSAAGTPMLKNPSGQQNDLQPVSARLLPPIFPDNPLVLEGMDCLYLNSEKAAELKITQVNALYAWLNAGGHLIIGIEQPSDVSALPWLKGLVPCDVKEMRAVGSHPQLQNWLKSPGWPTNSHFFAHNANSYTRPQRADIEASNPFADLPSDNAFEASDIQIATGPLREGKVVLSAGERPLIVSTLRGRGVITTLLFSPEREPFRSWKNLPTFWARLAEVPGSIYVEGNTFQGSGYSSDGVFGAMIDTKQIHKLPVEWLLVLLIVYLLVIGPLDQFWLKRINRPMLTWITFPCYVVLFSLLIYFIGYKLRSGESEWNELHLIDVLANGDQAELRGRTYASVYSPANQRYVLESPQKYATLRGEFAGSWGGGQSTEKATIAQNGDSFKAEVFVPVWTSQLLVSDWWQPAASPLDVKVTAEGDGWRVDVNNHTEHSLVNSHVAIEDVIMPLGELAAGEKKTFTVSRDHCTPIKEFAARFGQNFHQAAQSRQRSFGSTENAWISDLPNSTIAASFISSLGRDENGSSFLAPPGLDVSSMIEHGGAVLFAWSADYAPVKPLYQFVPRRAHKNTLWRVPVKLTSPSKV